MLHFPVERIEIYPYGGCSKFQYDINVLLWKEWLVLIMGPLVQCLFVFLIWFFKIDVPLYFYHYHIFILIFNLLPIYPLDGGRFVHLLFAMIFSYYHSLQLIYYFSFSCYCSIFLWILIFHHNLLFFSIFLLLGIKLYKEICQADYYFQKFLMERYLYTYSFSKAKTIHTFQQMKRDYLHYFVKKDRIYTEKKVLSDYFLDKENVYFCQEN